jgi:myo-inositol-1(or 4)-monophosphatase
LSPWDIAAASLIITEAGGLIGNFSGEADFLYQREVVAGNPKVYGQLVNILTPYTRVIKEDDKAASLAEAAPDATDAFVAANAETASAAPAEKKPRKAIKVAGPRTPRTRSGA